MVHTKQGALLVAGYYRFESYRDNTLRDRQARDTASINVNIWTGKRDRRRCFRK